MATNYSLYAIPAFWVVALYPHGYAVHTPYSDSSPKCSSFSGKSHQEKQQQQLGQLQPSQHHDHGFVPEIRARRMLRQV
jgi:hypothetical protein